MAGDNKNVYQKFVDYIDQGFADADWFGTIFRILQAKAYVDYNQNNNESPLDDSDTAFDDVFFNHNWNIALLTGTAISFFGGIATKAYQYYREKQLISYKYLLQQLRKQEIKTSVNVEKLLSHLQQKGFDTKVDLALLNGNIQAETIKVAKNAQILDKKIVDRDYLIHQLKTKKSLRIKSSVIKEINAEIDEIAIKRIQKRIAGYLAGENQLKTAKQYELDATNTTHIVIKEKKSTKEKPESELQQNLINELRTSSLGQYCKTVWNAAGKQTYIFWIAYMVIDQMFGRQLLKSDSALAKTVLMPIILGISVGAMVLFGLGKAMVDLVAYVKTRKEQLEKATPTLGPGKILAQFIGTVLAPPALAVTIVAMTGYTIGKSTVRLYRYLKSKVTSTPPNVTQKISGQAQQQGEEATNLIIEEPNVAQEKSKPHFEESTDLIVARLKQRVFGDFEHKHNKRILEKIFIAVPANKAKLESKPSGELKIAAGIVEDSTQSIPTHSELNEHSRKISDYLSSTKAKSRSKVALNAFLGGKDGFLQVAFVTWLVAAGLGWLGGAVPALSFLTTAAGFVGGPFTLLVGGALFGVILLVKEIARTRADQQAYKAKVEAILSEVVEKGAHGKVDITREQKFDQLYAAIEIKKKAITGLRAEIAKNCDPIARERWQVADYKLKHAPDAYDHDYAEKQRHKDQIPLFTYVKKGLKRFKEFVGGGQTGVLLVRLSLTAGGIAGAFAGLSLLFTPAVVIGAAVAAGLVFATCRLTQYLITRRQEHRMHMLMTLDDRIKRQEQTLDELSKLEQSLQKNLVSLEQKGDAPKVQSAAPVEATNGFNLTESKSSSCSANTDSTVEEKYNLIKSYKNPLYENHNLSSNDDNGTKEGSSMIVGEDYLVPMPGSSKVDGMEQQRVLQPAY